MGRPRKEVKEAEVESNLESNVEEKEIKKTVKIDAVSACTHSDGVLDRPKRQYK